jgi:hypothetical protein
MEGNINESDQGKKGVELGSSGPSLAGQASVSGFAKMAPQAALHQSLYVSCSAPSALVNHPCQALQQSLRLTTSFELFATEHARDEAIALRSFIRLYRIVSSTTLLSITL